MTNYSPLVGTARSSLRSAETDLKDPLPLVLHVPTAPHRPGDSPRFEPFPDQPGDLPKPDTLSPFDLLHNHAIGMIRVLGADGAAAGPWDPQLSPQQLRSGLEMMMRARCLDVRMIGMQRQGRLSFYLSSKGEEAVAVAGAMPYSTRDILFPSYRQPGTLLVRGMPLLAMMCHSISNRHDNVKGRQMPLHYSWKAGNVVSISSPVGTQLPQAVGAAMAFACRGERSVAAAWIGDGTSSQGDFHHAINFASVFLPPCILHVVNNQWAISTHCQQATGGTAFALRAEAYSLPGLRVDGNDFLAVFAVEQWAIERARRGGGPTLIELVTYRREAHSTSDDPTQYRPADEGNGWPGGDPIDRLKIHLIQRGEWSEEAHQSLDAALDQEVVASLAHAESFGSLASGLGHSPSTMFDDVYTNLPDHLRNQLREMQIETAKDEPGNSILPFVGKDRRAAG
ncbi:MAG: 3-methyl-2-oxobutanoate dehydrogenase (2-methylpropanoyl-transferring) subunit alpha [Planctomycetes bacterium]|nr:3-methyl-2-oxobutanoate dehydrogenase (2-methylpropanoyl-transferring) subunit alpha [Planctomycetota bacterium]